jgi:diacylglycerol kinase family enzyme
VLVVVNPAAHDGRAGRHWPAAHRALHRRHPDAQVSHPSNAAAATAVIHAGLMSGQDAVIAAGGDGTVNLALNALMDPATDRPRVPRVCLGAIALGSSNDFHKPIRAGRTLAGLPARIDMERAHLVDVGKATIELADGGHTVRYFLLNASLGLVADGNHLFNNPGPLIKWLKTRNVDVAITLCALRVITGRQFPRVVTHSAGWRHVGEVAAVGVLKSVHFAGGMHYDTGVVDNDGMFDVNIWRPAGRVSLLHTVFELHRGRFSASATAICRRSESLTVRPDRACAVELDGEVLSAVAVRFDVLPATVKVCA